MSCCGSACGFTEPGSTPERRAPGQHTAEYIDKVLTRLTVWGSLYVALVCLLPEFLISRFRVPFYFGGTSLLIIVVVIMDFMAQLQAHLMSHQYEGLMKKANLRGHGKSDSPGDPALAWP